MTADKIKEVVEKYKKIMKLLKIPKEKSDNYERCIRDKAKILAHSHYLLYEIDELLDNNRIEKAFHWLGFVQGCLFSFGLRSLDDLKNDNKSDDKEN